MSRPAALRESESGQALVEALVASAIIAAMLGVTCQSLITATRAEHMLRAKRAALPVAQSLLARVGADIPLVPGTIDGSSNGVDWQVEIGPYDGVSGRSVDGPPLLDIRVSAGAPGARNRSVELRTLRVGA